MPLGVMLSTMGAATVNWKVYGSVIASPATVRSGSTVPG